MGAVRVLAQLAVVGTPGLEEVGIALDGVLSRALDAGLGDDLGAVSVGGGREARRYLLNHLLQTLLAHLVSLVGVEPHGGGDRDAKGKQGAAVGVDPVGGAQHGGLGLNAYALHVGRGELVRGQAELGQPDEIRAQRLDTALHEDIVHVGMSPGVVLIDQSGLRRGIELLLERIDGKLGHDVGLGRGGHELHGGMELVVLDEGPGARGADGLLLQLLAFDLYDLDAALRQQLGHHLVVAARQRVEGLGADEAHRGAQGGGQVAGKDLEIQFDLILRSLVELLEEIGGECGLGDGIGAAFADGHIGEVGGAETDHLPPLLVVEVAIILLEGNNV